jgi:tetratricopeptide (TPR) repeat protein
MKTISIKIEDVTRILNPVMIPDVTELDEVVVTKSKRRSQRDLEEDYPINENIIKTAWGYVDVTKSPGQVWLMSETDINPVRLCILDLLRNRFPGISIIGNCTQGGSVVSRRFGSLTQPRGYSFDIDGQLFNDAPVWLPLPAIKRIAIFPGLAMSSRYGNFGAGGIIVINTINGNPQIEKVVDRARLRNNFLNSKVLTTAEVEANMPTYLRELQATTSREAAKAVFEKYDNQYGSSPYFYLDSYEYFYDEWNDISFADEVIDTKFNAFRNNAVLLKALAYIYEKQGRFEESNEVYKEVFILRPNYAQSYLDIANSYRNLKETKQAASIYARYEYLLNEGFMEVDTAGFGPIIYREFNNLLMLNKEAVVEGRKAKKLFVAEEEFEGTRLVFEWNDSEAEFELQFVNPGNQYHMWKHSLADNVEVIEREKEFGYNTTEYLMDGSLPGTWKINANYLGNKSLSPTYLKATVYHNYGSKAQRKEIKLFKLMLKNVNQELFELNISSRVN